MTKDTVSIPQALQRALVTAAGVIVFIAPAAVGARNAPQSRDVAVPATLPAFEEVSVRPNAASGPGGRGGGQMQPGRYVAQNLTLKNIIRRAFGVQGSQGPNSGIDLLEQQVAGGAEWVATDKWDVIATTQQATQPPEMRLMMQRMLAERFTLRAHWEKRELPVYVLSMARADGALGPGLRRTPDEECAKAKAAGPPPMPEPAQPGQPPPPMALLNCGAVQFGPGQLTARGAPIDFLAQALVNTPVITGIDRPVLDRTGLKGNFGFQLKFAPAANVNPDPDRPHLVTALTEQLGLKLEATQAPIDVLVIDSVERPTPN